MIYALFDIGGTKTRVAISRDLKRFETPLVYDTPKDFEEGFQRLKDTIIELALEEPITAIAGGIRGTLDHERDTLLNDALLTDWVGKSFGKRLSKELDAPVYLENDTALVGLGEAHYGAGMPRGVFVYHTVSSGVGGVRIVDGRIDVSPDGFEPGHQELDIDRSILGKDIPHTLENLVSGTSLERRMGRKAYEIPQEDPVWEELARFLAYGLKNSILYWSPERIVLGGSMIVGDPNIDIGVVREQLFSVIGEGYEVPELVQATLEDKGGLYGAMVLLTQILKNG